MAFKSVKPESMARSTSSSVAALPCTILFLTSRKSLTEPLTVRATILATANLTNGIDDFFGFQATGSDRIIRVEIRSRELNPVAGEGFYMDNFAGVFVPEPGTLVMLTLAVALIACRRSAKRYCGAD